MTRNEFIATTAARIFTAYYSLPTNERPEADWAFNAIEDAAQLADKLEEKKTAPWLRTQGYINLTLNGDVIAVYNDSSITMNVRTTEAEAWTAVDPESALNIPVKAIEPQPA